MLGSINLKTVFQDLNGHMTDAAADENHVYAAADENHVYNLIKIIAKNYCKI